MNLIGFKPQPQGGDVLRGGEGGIITYALQLHV